MSLKAGRVGVNPADVDPVSGHINSSGTDAYTKAQADNKFLSKSDAASTYESKSDASTAHNQLQPKTLAVPIEMLSGSKLTVESALQGLNHDGDWDLLTKDVMVTIEGVSTKVGTIRYYLNKLNCFYIVRFLGGATAIPVSTIVVDFTDVLNGWHPVVEFYNVMRGDKAQNVLCANELGQVRLLINDAVSWANGEVIGVLTKS